MSEMTSHLQFIAKTLAVFIFLQLLSSPLCYDLSAQVETTDKSVNEKNREFDGDEIKPLGNGWFRVVGKEVIQNITPEQAEQKAIFYACQNALQTYKGIEIRVRTLDIQAASQNKTLYNHFSEVCEQFTSGKILEKRIIHKERRIEGEDFVIVVVLEVRVGRQKGEEDPYFNVEAELNKHNFKEGDELELTVQASKDCYITVLNICSNDSVYALFPNQYRSNNFVKAGQLFRLPNENDKEMGISFLTILRQEKDEDRESIKILATKENIPLFKTSNPFSPYGTYEMTLMKLLNWLIRIPRNQIEEADKQYFITK